MEICLLIKPCEQRVWSYDQKQRTVMSIDTLRKSTKKLFHGLAKDLPKQQVQKTVACYTFKSLFKYIDILWACTSASDSFHPDCIRTIRGD